MGLKRKKSERASPTLVGGYPPFSAEGEDGTRHEREINISHFSIVGNGK